jgi:hypothetical protein
LKLTPVHHYLPAGDSYAATHIRAWLREWQGVRPEYHEARKVSAEDENRANMIVIGNPRSTPSICDFQNENYRLKLRLTDNGIEFDRRRILDDVGGEDGERAHVVVTNWVKETGNVLTLIASNHTRAIDAVSQHLTGSADSVLDDDGLIPNRFQLGYTVLLKAFGTQASEIKLLDELGGRAIIYP